MGLYCRIARLGMIKDRYLYLFEKKKKHAPLLHLSYPSSVPPFLSFGTASRSLEINQVGDYYQLNQELWLPLFSSCIASKIL